ncbi:Phosphosulfolactate synthase [Candidatus Hydrogenisulfobacillus filiaventi]|uniref:Phosphosulfolactate synthase n=1 Tax=Candidatus Hydrogenisulfobacillus filiaventi TaxID=2707344 RepID=A0A6F8ZGR2_9FIRM|nr:phosphosulfolactate synthase [Bacillota bacterium]CAB1129130.1 Phosphosulfolactate synthase [Candidatus Hydrogenisulfobacillus filiaventi]
MAPYSEPSRVGEGSARKAWAGVLAWPYPDRSGKPRRFGRTMVIDKGLGLTDTRDLMELGADYVDYVKLTFGTSAFYPAALLRRKIALVRQAGVEIFPGGTFLELAALQGKLEAFLDRAAELGFTGIEVSDGTVRMDPRARRAAIQRARRWGFRFVLSEVGKKDPRDRVPTMALWEQVERDLEAGADLVIVEGRESGAGVVIYDAQGAIIDQEVEALVTHVSDPRRLLWEAPRKHQQQELIARFGPDVNLGNVHPEDVLALEALRVGLRADTLRRWIAEAAGRGEVAEGDILPGP